MRAFAPNERAFWQEFSRGLRAAAGSDVLVMFRVETATQVGVPDVFYATERNAGWVELKVEPVSFQLGQQSMLRRLRRAGVTALLAVRSKSGLELYEGNFASGPDYRFPEPIDWEGVLGVLEGDTFALEPSEP